MNKEAILELVKNDPWMINMLVKARDLDLPDWMIGAGFVRNKIWDHLHGFISDKVPTADIDLIYFEPNGNSAEEDNILSKQVSERTGFRWEIVNQAYTHTWHNRPPYKNTEEALSEWVETPTCIAIRLISDDSLSLYAPHGIEDLVTLKVRPTPNNFDTEAYKTRQLKKDWKKKWPKLNIIDPSSQNP
jgi:hypothetical protein